MSAFGNPSRWQRPFYLGADQLKIDQLKRLDYLSQNFRQKDIENSEVFWYPSRNSACFGVISRKGWFLHFWRKGQKKNNIRAYEICALCVAAFTLHWHGSDVLQRLCGPHSLKWFLSFSLWEKVCLLLL